MGSQSDSGYYIRKWMFYIPATKSRQRGRAKWGIPEARGATGPCHACDRGAIAEDGKLGPLRFPRSDDFRRGAAVDQLARIEFGSRALRLARQSVLC